MTPSLSEFVHNGPARQHSRENAAASARVQVPHTSLKPSPAPSAQFPAKRSAFDTDNESIGNTTLTSLDHSQIDKYLPASEEEQRSSDDEYPSEISLSQVEQFIAPTERADWDKFSSNQRRPLGNNSVQEHERTLETEFSEAAAQSHQYFGAPRQQAAGNSVSRTELPNSRSFGRRIIQSTPSNLHSESTEQQYQNEPGRHVQNTRRFKRSLPITHSNNKYPAENSPTLYQQLSAHEADAVSPSPKPNPTIARGALAEQSSQVLTSPESRANDECSNMREEAGHTQCPGPSNSETVELDYPDAELQSMEFSQLVSQRFEDDPKRLHHSAFPDDLSTKTLNEQLSHLYSLRRASASNEPPTSSTTNTSSEEEEEDSFTFTYRTFFSTLSIDEYDECGDLLLDRLSAIVNKFRESRHARRKAAVQFEGEIAERETLVRKREDGVKEDLARLRRGGEEVVRGNSS